MSGNPKGRPKGTKSARTSLQEAINQTVTVVVDGKHRKLTKLQAAFVQQANKAAKGDGRAMQLLLKWCETYGLGPSPLETDPVYNDPRTADELRKELDEKLDRIYLNKIRSGEFVIPDDLQIPDRKPTAEWIIESDDELVDAP